MYPENENVKCCGNCVGCTFIHEYDIYFCNLTNQRIELHDEPCSAFQKYEEEGEWS